MRLWVTMIGGLLAIACAGPLISRITSPSESRPRPETSTGHSTVGECEAPKPSDVKDGARLGIYGYELSAIVGFRRQEAFDLAPDERPRDDAGWPSGAFEVKGVAHSRGYGRELDELVDGCGYAALARA